MKSKTFSILLTVCALLIASAAAFFSIFGLSKLFAGAALSIIIMASALEIGKLISVTYIYRFWEKTAIWLRVYFLTGIFILMMITSLGIYGYMTSAYQSASQQSKTIDRKVELFEKKKVILTQELNSKTMQFKSLNERIQSKNQRDLIFDTISISKTNQSKWIALQQSKGTKDDIKNLESQLTLVSQQITNFNDSISKYDTEILNAQQSLSISDVGPLKYLSELLNTSMDKVVNILILLIIFVFDPLAVCLIIAANQMFLKSETTTNSTDNTKDALPTMSVIENVKKNVSNFYGKRKVDSLSK